MISVRDSGKFIVPLASVMDVAHACGFDAPVSLKDLVTISGCPHANWINLHLKILTSPTNDLEAMLDRTRQVYDTVGIAVVVASREELTAATLGAATFNDLDAMDVSGCDSAAYSTNQTDLYAMRNNADSNDLCIYFVTSVTETTGTLNGCAAHPAGQPGAVIASIASMWTVAHEIGHVLGLSHISGEHVGCTATAPECCMSADFTRVMTGCSTSKITGTPTFSSTEAATMKASSFVHS